MDKPDERIGRNLQNLRGDQSQASLAAAMKQRGWRWSQPTVAAIEKGERALKLAEAIDLCSILGIEPTDLLPRSEGLEAAEVARAWAAVQRDIDLASQRLASLALTVNRFADLAEADPRAFTDVADALWGPGDSEWPEWIGWSAELYGAFPERVTLVHSEARRDRILAALEAVAQCVVAVNRTVGDEIGTPENAAK